VSDDITVFAASKMLSVKLIIIPTPYPDSCSDFVGAESGILLLRFSLTDQEVLKSWITAHPEVTLGSLGEFETCPDWVPVMDTGQQFARIALKTMGDHGFDHRANREAKVRNVMPSAG
jgi:hypothetical protein